jgi:hypothetical protein
LVRLLLRDGFTSVAEENHCVDCGWDGEDEEEDEEDSDEN